MSDTKSANTGSILTRAASMRKEHMKLNTEAGTQGRHTDPAKCTQDASRLQGRVRLDRAARASPGVQTAGQVAKAVHLSSLELVTQPAQGTLIQV